ncbi:hypothetical protein HPB50_024576 [Hyalomma asiaticum]|uniref:Uncharacterized protein n=1 Tax=Hyalomma asiaticum TaxID=266040 RepID=A0ACB7T1S2_HYAAI|nr:hypothetical protein HPB50_024576 [Hyalomma asiaticum]
MIQGWSAEAVQDSVVVYQLQLRNSVPRIEKAVIVSSFLDFSMTEAVDEFVKTVSKFFDDKRKVVMEIVSDINAALQRIDENEKMLDAIKAAMEATWNVLT